MWPLRILKPKRDHLEFLHSIKNFKIEVQGEDENSIWFSETLSMVFTSGYRYGTETSGGVTRYVSNTNGGPVFVYVKQGKIIRITPIEFDDRGCGTLDDQGKRQVVQPAPENDHMQPHSGVEIDGVLARIGCCIP